MRRRAANKWVTTVCLTVLAARTSIAQRPPAPSPAPSEEHAAAPSAGSGASADVDAWFREASVKFQAGDFAGALPLLERACATSAFPGCALNLGAVHHALRHCPEARHYYESYLRDEPAGERATEARAALTELEPHCKSNAAAFDLAASTSLGASTATPASAPAAPHAIAGAAAVASGAAASTAVPPEPGAPPASPVTAVNGSAPAAALVTAAPADASRIDSADALDPSQESAAKYRPIAASMLILGGAAGLTTIYLGVRLADANSEFRKHRNTAFDDEQQARLDRTRQYRALTVGSGVASALLLGAGGVIWWLGSGSEANDDLAIAPNGLTGVQVSGRF
jgi:hypothetical protein